MADKGEVIYRLGDVIYRLPDYTLADLSDETVRQMTERDLQILAYIRTSPLNSAAVMDELRLMQRWDKLHPDRRTTMVTRASGSQSTQHAPKAGQNKPISGGAAGQGKARGGATMPNITKTSPKTIPTKR